MKYISYTEALHAKSLKTTKTAGGTILRVNCNLPRRQYLSSIRQKSRNLKLTSEMIVFLRSTKTLWGKAISKQVYKGKAIEQSCGLVFTKFTIEFKKKHDFSI